VKSPAQMKISPSMFFSIIYWNCSTFEWVSETATILSLPSPSMPVRFIILTKSLLNTISNASIGPAVQNILHDKIAIDQ